jgi:hypothetical protein
MKYVIVYIIEIGTHMIRFAPRFTSERRNILVKVRLTSETARGYTASNAGRWVL